MKAQGKPRIHLKTLPAKVTRLRAIESPSPWTVIQCLECALDSARSSKGVYATKCYVILMDDRGQDFQVQGFGSGLSAFDAVPMLWTEIVRLTQRMGVIPRQEEA